MQTYRHTKTAVQARAYCADVSSRSVKELHTVVVCVCNSYIRWRALPIPVAMRGRGINRLTLMYVSLSRICDKANTVGPIHLPYTPARMRCVSKCLCAQSNGHV